MPAKNYPSNQKKYRNNKRLANKDSVNEYNREYWSKNKEVMRQKQNARRANNIEKSKEYGSKAYYKNIEASKISQKKYRDNNKEYFALKSRMRRLKLRKFGTISAKEINKLLEISNYKCAYCQIDVKRGINMHLDHKVPLSRAGIHCIENLAVSCDKCNLKKGSMTVEEFLMKMARKK